MYRFCTRKIQQEDTEYALHISVTYCCGKLTQRTINNSAILDYTVTLGVLVRTQKQEERRQWSNVTGFIWQRIRREVGDVGAGRQAGRPKREPVREEKRGKTNRGKTLKHKKHQDTRLPPLRSRHNTPLLVSVINLVVGGKRQLIMIYWHVSGTNFIISK